MHVSWWKSCGSRLRLLNQWRETWRWDSATWAELSGCCLAFCFQEELQMAEWLCWCSWVDLPMSHRLDELRQWAIPSGPCSATVESWLLTSRDFWSENPMGFSCNWRNCLCLQNYNNRHIYIYIIYMMHPYIHRSIDPNIHTDLHRIHKIHMWHMCTFLWLYRNVSRSIWQIRWKDARLPWPQDVSRKLLQLGAEDLGSLRHWANLKKMKQTMPKYGVTTCSLGRKMWET